MSVATPTAEPAAEGGSPASDASPGGPRTPAQSAIRARVARGALAITAAATAAHATMVVACCGLLPALVAPESIRLWTTAIGCALLCAAFELGETVVQLAGDRLIRRVGTRPLRRIVPLLAVVLVASLTHADVVAGSAEPTALRGFVATVGFSWACGVLVWTTARRTMTARTARLVGTEPSSDVRVEPWSMAGATLASVVDGSLAATIWGWTSWVVLDPLPVTPTLAAAHVALIAGLGVAGLGAYLVGDGLARTLGAVTKRLAGGLGERPEPLSSSVTGAVGEELGALFLELERLRERLGAELASYETALARTRQADRAKAEFLAAVSHELRTPLNSIVGFAQLMLEDDEQPLSAAQAEDLRLIRSGGDQLLALLNDILDISMIESGELSLQRGRLDLAVLAEDIVKIHRPLVHDRPIELLLVRSTQPAWVDGDRRRLAQVLTNLLSNAIKFTERGSVTVKIATIGRSVHLSVEDTGCGIAPDDLEAIFEEYRQVGALRRRSKGTGLGLAIARSLAHAHGGELWAESELGHGARFRLTLPAASFERGEVGPGVPEPVAAPQDITAVVAEVPR